MLNTSEQEAAFVDLRKAIDRVLRSNSSEPSVMDRYFATEYVVLCSHAGLEGEDSTTMVNIIFDNNDVPIHRAMGLVEWARGWLSSYNEDD